MSYYGSSASSGWKPGKNKTILTRSKTKSSSPRAARSFASKSTSTMRGSGYGSDVPTAYKKKNKTESKPKKTISKTTAQSFVGKPYGSTSRTPTPTPKRVQSAAKRAVAVRSPSEPKQAKRSQTIAEKLRTRNFKGKYIGPDQFKGDLSKVRAWRKAGRRYDANGNPVT